jgi:hypothetical protein
VGKGFPTVGKGSHPTPKCNMDPQWGKGLVRLQNQKQLRSQGRRGGPGGGGKGFLKILREQCYVSWNSVCVTNSQGTVFRNVFVSVSGLLRENNNKSSKIHLEFMFFFEVATIS